MDKKKFIPFGGNETQINDINQSRIVVLPLCYENAPSYGTGSGQAPFHILDASLHVERLDEEAMVDWSTHKIHTLQPLFPSDDPQEAVAEMERAAEDVINRNKFLLSLGGDHAVSIGLIKAAANIYPDIGVLQIDAHLDFRDEWKGSRYNHACVMRRVVEDMKLPVVQVGIRSFSPEEAEFAASRNLTPFYAHKIDPLDYTWIEAVIDALPSKVYITLDLDGLDPGVIPGTGTPEPGGLSYRQIVELLKKVGWKKKVVAADINELVKIEGTNVSEFTAAKIATKIFVYCF
ncbi:MAG: agmatinase [Desulfobacterales bacterium]